MVTGIGYCGRIGKRKRERQIREITDHPERYNFYPPSTTRDRKITITYKNGKTTTKRY